MKGYLEDIKWHIGSFEISYLPFPTICVCLKASLEYEKPAPTPMCTAPGFEDFILFNGDCFLFIDEVQTFDDAEAHCKQQGAHLASINNAGSEYLAITAINSAEAWIGLSNKKVLALSKKH